MLSDDDEEPRYQQDYNVGGGGLNARPSCHYVIHETTSCILEQNSSCKSHDQYFIEEII